LPAPTACSRQRRRRGRRQRQSGFKRWLPRRHICWYYVGLSWWLLPPLQRGQVAL
jgi:hypothetical protein